MSEFATFMTLWLDGAMEWRAPVWLWGLLVPFIWLLWSRLLVRKSKQAYADAHLWPWVQVRHESAPLAAQATTHSTALKFVLQLGQRISNLITPLRLLAVAWLCLMVALAGPRSLQTQELESNRSGVDILVLMDLSHSMTAEDVYPNRFLQAKTFVETLKNGLQSDDRLALMGFAGQPHLLSPLSFDRDLFQHSLDLLQPDMLPTQGSWLELALIAGTNHLLQTAGEAKVMLVLTNGNPLFWQTPELPQVVQALPFAKDLRASSTGVKTIVVGIGQPAPSTLADSTHKSGKLHANGVLVQSRLEEMSLKKWAHNLQGSYLRGSDSREFLQRLMQEVTLPAGERSQLSDHQNWNDYSAPFMTIAVLSLLLAFYPLSVRRMIFRKATQTVASPALIGVALLLLWISLPSPALAAASTIAKQQQAYQAYLNGDYAAATALYDQIDNYQGWMGAGSSAYRAEDIESAVLYFRQAAQMAHSDAQRSQALFNLGNSYYVTNLLPQAIESYQQALLYQSDYPEAEHNLALAQQRQQLEQANKKQKQGEEQAGDEGEEGSKGRGDDGAFYGGQKPNASDENPGFGADGDAIGGDRSGEAAILPMQEALTDYQLQSAQPTQLSAEQRAAQANANAIMQRQQRLQRAQAFQQQLLQIEDQQRVLLQRLFEREEGFQAPQSQPHPIPGVQPW